MCAICKPLNRISLIADSFAQTNRQLTKRVHALRRRLRGAFSIGATLAGLCERFIRARVEVCARKHHTKRMPTSSNRAVGVIYWPRTGDTHPHDLVSRLICVEILEAPAALCGARRLRPRDVRRDFVFDIKRCAHSYVARAWASRYSRRTCACALRRGKLKGPPFRVSVKFIYHPSERVRKRVHACETRMIHAICIEHVVVCRAHVRYRTPQEGTTDRVNARVHTKHE